MEFEQLNFWDILSQQKLGYDERNESFRSSLSADGMSVSNDPSLSRRIESFQMLENGTPKSESADSKLSWLRSQVIGNTVEFDTPFGKRRLTYADHTASGRCLQFIEDYVMDKVLPFYGMFSRLPFLFHCLRFLRGMDGPRNNKATDLLMQEIVTLATVLLATKQPKLCTKPPTMSRNA
jgi:hypothetical protein